MSRLSEERRQAQDEYLRQAALDFAIQSAAQSYGRDERTERVLEVARDYLAFLVAGQHHA